MVRRQIGGLVRQAECAGAWCQGDYDGGCMQGGVSIITGSLGQVPLGRLELRNQNSLKITH